MSRSYVMAAGAMVALLAAPARAQNVQRFQPTPGAGFLTVDGTRTLPPGALTPSLYVSFGGDPLVERDAQGDVVDPYVGGLLGIEVLGAYGLLVDGLEVGVALPMALVSGAGIEADGNDGFALGDARLVPRYRMWRDEALGVAVAVALPVSFPTGSDDKLVGGEGFGVHPKVIGEWRGFGLRAAVNAGFRYRSGEARFGNIELGNEVAYGGAVRSKLWAPEWAAVVELFGAVAVGDVVDDTVTDPIELLAALRWDTGAGLATLGGGAGLVPDAGAPDFRVLAGYAYAFDPPDPSAAPPEPVAEPEPEPEPKPVAKPKPEPEPVAKPEPAPRAKPVAKPKPAPKPAPAPVVAPKPAPVPVVAPVAKKAAFQHIRPWAKGIVFMTPIAFDGDALAPASLPVLDEVAAVLVPRPTIRHVRVGSHLEPGGKAKAALARSERRAAAVVAYLVGKGVAAKRLAAVGYGATTPPPKGKVERVDIDFVAAQDMPTPITSITVTPTPAALEFVFSAGRPLAVADASVSLASRGAVLIIRIANGQTGRKWQPQVKDKSIKRALLHPSSDTPPAAVLRIRMKAKLGAGVPGGAKVTAESGKLRVVVPRK